MALTKKQKEILIRLARGERLWYQGYGCSSDHAYCFWDKDRLPQPGRENPLRSVRILNRDKLVEYIKNPSGHLRSCIIEITQRGRDIIK